MIREADFYAAVVESSIDAIVTKDIEGIVRSWNPAAEKLFGYSEDEMVGQSIRRLLPPDRQDEEDLILSRIRAGEKVGQFFTKRLHKSGRQLDISVTISPVRDKSGLVVGASKIARDVGPYLEDQRRIRESEQRFHLLADNISQFAWIARPDGHIFWYNQRWYDYTGVTPEDMVQGVRDKLVHPDYVERVYADFREALAKGEDWEDTFPLRSKDGEYRWFLSRALPVRDEDGEISGWFGTNTDITEQRDQAEQIRLLLLEVNHRSKNMLSTVQALARRSMGTDTPFLSRFQDRVRSLALNQDILVRREWREVPLEELIQLQLDFIEHARGNIEIDGPELALSPRAAEIIGMALHELATNSLKYGALSGEGGSVSITWQVERDEGRFALEWRETGGPEVSEPAELGFGSTLICDVPRRFCEGEVEIDYARKGIVWSLNCSLDVVEAQSSEGPLRLGSPAQA